MPKFRNVLRSVYQVPNKNCIVVNLTRDIKQKSAFRAEYLEAYEPFFNSKSALNADFPGKITEKFMHNFSNIDYHAFPFKPLRKKRCSKDRRGYSGSFF